MTLNQNTLEILVKLVTFFIPFLFSLCFHEVAHGYVAKLRGDNTAERMGRLTMNPFAHADLFGTLIFPIISILGGFSILFGWAKPVPVDVRNLKNPRVDMFWIALAGPLSNIVLGLIGAFSLTLIFYKFPNMYGATGLMTLLKEFIIINLFLAVYNMIPIHPLDGGKVISRFLPHAWNRKLEENEQILSLVLLVLIIGGFLRFMMPIIYLTYDSFIRIAEMVIN